MQIWPWYLEATNWSFTPDVVLLASHCSNKHTLSILRFTTLVPCSSLLPISRWTLPICLTQFIPSSKPLVVYTFRDSNLISTTNPNLDLNHASFMPIAWLKVHISFTNLKSPKSMRLHMFNETPIVSQSLQPYPWTTTVQLTSFLPIPTFL